MYRPIGYGCSYKIIIYFKRFEMYVHTRRRAVSLRKPLLQAVTDIAIFFEFSRWRPSATLDFKHFGFLMAGRVQGIKMRHRANSWRSVKPLPIYGDLPIFSIWRPSVRHLGFVMRVWITHKEHFMVALYGIGQTIIFSCCYLFFFLLLSSFFLA